MLHPHSVMWSQVVSQPTKVIQLALDQWGRITTQWIVCCKRKLCCCFFFFVRQTFSSFFLMLTITSLYSLTKKENCVFMITSDFKYYKLWIKLWIKLQAASGSQMLIIIFFSSVILVEVLTYLKKTRSAASSNI